MAFALYGDGAANQGQAAEVMPVALSSDHLEILAIFLCCPMDKWSVACQYKACDCCPGMLLVLLPVYSVLQEVLTMAYTFWRVKF